MALFDRQYFRIFPILLNFHLFAAHVKHSTRSGHQYRMYIYPLYLPMILRRNKGILTLI
jgi:hypothetical protein